MLLKVSGWGLLALGAWMLISPQAQLGLKGLNWMQDYAFPGEALFGILLTVPAYYLLNFKLEDKNMKK
jgi:hypothetical protein